ncbi:hypothetical protein RUND412_006976 [Rhizina undulata]
MALAPPQPSSVEIYPASTADDWVNEREDCYGEISSQPKSKTVIHPVSFVPETITTTNEVVAAPAPLAAAASAADNNAAVITVNTDYSLSRLHPGLVPESPESPDGISSRGSYFSQPSSNETVPASESLELERAGVRELREGEGKIKHSDRTNAGGSSTCSSSTAWSGGVGGAMAYPVPLAVPAVAVHHPEPRGTIATGSHNYEDPEHPNVDVANVDVRESSSYVWRVLVYLTFLNPFLCLANALYTIAVLIIQLALSPIRLISPNVLPASISLITHLTYLLSLHLRFLYPRPQPLPHPQDFNARRLVTVHLLGPLLCLPFSICAGFMVLVWLYTEVLLGEKNGAKGPEYRSVVFAKRRWEGFLLSTLNSKMVGEF